MLETENFKGYKYQGSQHSRNLTEMNRYDVKMEKPEDSFIRQNEALIESIKKGQPVRVKKHNPNYTVNISTKDVKRLLPPIEQISLESDETLKLRNSQLPGASSVKEVQRHRKPVQLRKEAQEESQLFHDNTGLSQQKMPKQETSDYLSLKALNLYHRRNNTSISDASKKRIIRMGGQNIAADTKVIKEDPLGTSYILYTEQELKRLKKAERLFETDFKRRDRLFKKNQKKTAYASMKTPHHLSKKFPALFEQEDKLGKVLDLKKNEYEQAMREVQMKYEEYKSAEKLMQQVKNT